MSEFTYDWQQVSGVFCRLDDDYLLRFGFEVDTDTPVAPQVGDVVKLTSEAEPTQDVEIVVTYVSEVTDWESQECTLYFFTVNGHFKSVRLKDGD